MGRLTSVLRSVGAIGAAGVVFLLVVSAASGSTPTPTFTLTIVPNTLTAGLPAVAVGSFTNNGPAVTQVAVTFTFPFSVKVNGNHCVSVPFFPKTVICSLGSVASGATATTAIPFTAPAATGSFTLQGLAGWLTPGSPPKAGLLTASTTGNVFANNDPAHKGTCTTAPSTATTATADNHQIALDTLPTPTNSALVLLGCTPVGVSVDPPPAGFRTETLSVFVPQLTTPAQVTLTFPDEFLPGGFDTDIHKHLPPLHEFSDAGVDLGAVVNCVSGAIPGGYDSCILGIHSTDTDHDSDAGTIDLLVQGNGVGDPRFAG